MSSLEAMLNEIRLPDVPVAVAFAERGLIKQRRALADTLKSDLEWTRARLAELRRHASVSAQKVSPATSNEDAADDDLAAVFSDLNSSWC